MDNELKSTLPDIKSNYIITSFDMMSPQKREIADSDLLPM